MRISIILFLILTVLIGCIYIYPDLRFIADLGNSFKGITLTAAPDEEFYLSRLNAVYKGDYKLANVGLYEHQNDIWIIPPYFEVIIGLIGKTLGIPVAYLDIILSFIFPVIIFWLIFLLASRLSDSNYLGIFAAVSIIMAYTLFTFKFTLFKSIFMPPYYTVGLWFLRPFSPQLAYIPFIFSLFAIYLFIDSKILWKTFIISFSIAIVNYLHIALWLFICAGLSIWLLISIFNKDKLFIKNILFISLCSFILTIPYWTNYSKLLSHPNYRFLELMFHDYTRKPIIPFGYVLLSSLALYLNKGQSKKKLLFLLSFLAGGLLCLNQQILTGKITAPIHWTSYSNKTFLIIALIVGLRRIAPKYLSKPAKNVLVVVAIIPLFFVGFIQQNNYYNSHKNTFQKMQNLSGAIIWLNNNTQKDDVILTESIGFPGSELSRTLTLYTRNYYYLGQHECSLISEEEFHYRTLAAMRFFHYTKSEAYKVIEYLGGINFAGLTAAYGTLKDKDTYLNKIKIKYENLMAKNPLSLIKRYKVDYLLIRREDMSFENIANIYSTLDKTFDDGFCKIYRFR